MKLENPLNVKNESSSVTINMINILLIFKNMDLQNQLDGILKNYFQGEARIQCLPTLQDAIELLELKSISFDLIVLEQNTPSFTMSKMILSLGGNAKFILCSDNPVNIESVRGEYRIEQLQMDLLESSIIKTIHKFEEIKHLIPTPTPKDEFVSVSTQIMASYCPLNYDVYIKLIDGRFLKIFKKGDPVEKSDFDDYQLKKHVDLFYFKKAEYQEVLDKEIELIEKITNTVPIPVVTVHMEAVKAHVVVSDLIKQMGFTSGAQMIAKSAVMMIVKLIGLKPQLSKILTDLKHKEGDYVSTHSIALGEIACAIAHQMELNSAATFFKLTLAAFIHDITLDDRLAIVKDVSSKSTSEQYSVEDLHTIKIHPIHAADYVRKMNEIPPDVDQIVYQHHERPDGSGFPRNLSGSHISPLSAIFITSHELLDFLLENENGTLQTFLSSRVYFFQHGFFKKIWAALR